MRKPKIGDIVWYTNSNKNIWPAIITLVYRDFVDLLVFNTQLEHKTHVIHSLFSRIEYWSWPEEEKQEKKPKECKHEYVASYCGYRLVEWTCKKCHYLLPENEPITKEKREREHSLCQNIADDIAEKTVEKYVKAEELIDKAWVLLQKRKALTGRYNHLCELYTLIKEYKGIK